MFSQTRQNSGDELDPNARKARNGPSGTPRISPPGSRSAVARNARAVVPVSLFYFLPGCSSRYFWVSPNHSSFCVV